VRWTLSAANDVFQPDAGVGAWRSPQEIQPRRTRSPNGEEILPRWQLGNPDGIMTYVMPGKIARWWLED
jgi:hypothetical protein